MPLSPYDPSPTPTPTRTRTRTRSGSGGSGDSQDEGFFRGQFLRSPKKSHSKQPQQQDPSQRRRGKHRHKRSLSWDGALFANRSADQHRTLFAPAEAEAAAEAGSASASPRQRRRQQRSHEAVELRRRVLPRAMSTQDVRLGRGDRREWSPHLKSASALDPGLAKGNKHRALSTPRLKSAKVGAVGGAKMKLKLARPDSPYIREAIALTPRKDSSRKRANNGRRSSPSPRMSSFGQASGDSAHGSKSKTPSRRQPGRHTAVQLQKLFPGIETPGQPLHRYQGGKAEKGAQSRQQRKQQKDDRLDGDCKSNSDDTEDDNETYGVRFGPERRPMTFVYDPTTPRGKSGATHRPNQLLHQAHAKQTKSVKSSSRSMLKAPSMEMQRSQDVAHSQSRQCREMPTDETVATTNMGLPGSSVRRSGGRQKASSFRRRPISAGVYTFRDFKQEQRSMERLGLTAMDQVGNDSVDEKVNPIDTRDFEDDIKFTDDGSSRESGGGFIASIRRQRATVIDSDDEYDGSTTLDRIRARRAQVEQEAALTEERRRQTESALASAAQEPHDDYASVPPPVKSKLSNVAKVGGVTKTVAKVRHKAGHLRAKRAQEAAKIDEFVTYRRNAAAITIQTQMRSALARRHLPRHQALKELINATKKASNNGEAVEVAALAAGFGRAAKAARQEHMSRVSKLSNEVSAALRKGLVRETDSAVTAARQLLQELVEAQRNAEEKHKKANAAKEEARRVARASEELQAAIRDALAAKVSEKQIRAALGAEASPSSGGLDIGGTFIRGVASDVPRLVAARDRVRTLRYQAEKAAAAAARLQVATELARQVGHVSEIPGLQQRIHRAINQGGVFEDALVVLSARELIAELRFGVHAAATSLSSLTEAQRECRDNDALLDQEIERALRIGVSDDAPEIRAAHQLANTIRVEKAERQRQNEAATVIQRHGRGLLARVTLRHQRTAVVLLQAQCRAWLTRKLVQQIQADRRHALLSAMRSDQQKIAQQWAEQDAEQRRRIAAVTVIQCRIRGMLARVFFTCALKSVVCMQCAWRQHCARGELKTRRRILIRRNAAASTLQRHVRGMLQRTKISAMHRSAVLMQTHWRSHRARVNVQTRRGAHRAHAATVIQSQWRGKAARNLAKGKRLHVQAVRQGATMQVLLRGAKIRKRVLDKKMTATLIQARWRGYLARRIAREQAELRRIAAAAEAARIATERGLAATRVQAQWRARSARTVGRHRAAQRADKIAREQRASSLKIQAIWRGKQGRGDARRLAEAKAERERVEAERIAALREVAATRAEAIWRGHRDRNLVVIKRRKIAAAKAEAERIAAEKAEAERIAAEKAEAERIEAERIAAEKVEAERIAAEKAEAERIAAEKAEAERIAAEKVEAERIAAEKAEAERIAAEKAEAERIAAEKAEADRIEAERIAAEKVEAERIAAQKAEAERIAAEKAEAERIAAEKVAAERIAAEKAEAERIAAKKAEAERIEAERIVAEKAEADRIAAEKAEAERIAAEKAEAERIAAEKAEAERIAAEKAEAERIAAEKVEAERIAAEKAEAERIAAEKAEAERVAAKKAEADRIEAERIAAEKVEAERIAAQKAEAERIAAEKAEAERIAAEKVAAERIAAEKAEAERIAAKKAEAERIEAERIVAEKAEADRIAAEKAEAERIAAEKAEAKRIAAEKIEAERIAAEKAEAERMAAENAEAERIAALEAQNAAELEMLRKSSAKGDSQTVASILLSRLENARASGEDLDVQSLLFEPFRAAIDSNHASVVEVLARFASADTLNCPLPGSNGNPPLLDALRMKADDVAMALLGLKADPTVRAADGASAAEVAIFEGSPDSLRLLMDAGVVDPNEVSRIRP